MSSRRKERKREKRKRLRAGNGSPWPGRYLENEFRFVGTRTKEQFADLADTERPAAQDPHSAGAFDKLDSDFNPTWKKR